METSWKIIKNIRMICADMVEEAKSGHPGAPLGLAGAFFMLYSNHFNFDPDDSQNKNRDILVLSNGHACAIQYVMNYFLGYLTIEDLKMFRKINSKTPGHPERNEYGIEITTGPLGQGIANAVGFAIALSKRNIKHTKSDDEAIEGKKLKRVVDLKNEQRVYCFFGDGCYQEGLSHEAFSIAAHYKLSNLTFIYDFNGITIDGPTSLSMSDDPILRFKSMGFFVVEVDGDNDLDGIDSALGLRKDVPVMIILKTTIGKDSSLEGNQKCHGEPLGSANIEKLRQKYKFEKFEICEEAKKHFLSVCEKMREKFKKLVVAEKNIPKINDQCNLKIPKFLPDKKTSTRQHFHNALNLFGKNYPLFGGSADLTPSNLTKWDDSVEYTAENRNGNYIRYGIREHAMFAIMNGIAAVGDLIPFGGTFLNFVTYGFTPLRLAAMSNLHTIYILTHDSIGLGQDGPTHQPIEVLPLLRATPNLVTIRPADGMETYHALKYALDSKSPTALILSRQNLAEISTTSAELLKGAYFVKKAENETLCLVATGSEVSLCLEAAKILDDKKIFTSVVSFPSFELFEKQSDEYKKKILGSKLRISVEMSSTLGWMKYVHHCIGIDRFGLSGPLDDLLEFFGFTPQKIADRVQEILKNHD
ncbi:Transketolase 1 [Dictyocoela muelleri]|nr:Transketolase 1 [Dictyocoela muelleri]